MAQAKHLTNASGAAVLLLTDDGRWLELATPDEAWLKMKPGLRFLVQGSLAEMAIASQKVQVSNRAQDDERTASMRALLQTVELHSLLCAPLTAQNKNLGVLMIWNRRDQSFSEADRRLMSLFADQAALAWHNAQLHAQNRQLAIVQERHRLARDLHDSVTQSLYSIGLAAQSTLWLLEQEGADARARDNLEHIHTVSESALNEIRGQLYHLHPTVLNEDLVEALTQHCNLLRKQYGLDISLKARLELTLSEDQRNALYYITREALWNIVKHANATQVDVRLTRQDKHIILSIHDNGVGFDPQASNGSGRMGLRNIEERVQLLHGRFNLHSSLEQGTQITVYLPLQGA